MGRVNGVLNRLFEVVLAPLATLPVLGSLAMLSLVTGAAILLVMQATSNPAALTATKRQMYADLLEVRLFKDDVSAMSRALYSLHRHNLRYLRLTAVAALWTIVPLTVTVLQLQCFFGYSGVTPIEPVLVTAVSRPGGFQDASLTLTVPPGVRLETPPIVLPALGETVWRVAAESPGNYVLVFRAGGEVYEKTFDASPDLVRRSPMRSTDSTFDEILNPSEPPLPESAPLSSIRIAYPERRIHIFGTSVGWLTVYTLMTVGSALAINAPLSRVLRRR